MHCGPDGAATVPPSTLTILVEAICLKGTTFAVPLRTAQTDLGVALLAFLLSLKATLSDPFSISLFLPFSFPLSLPFSNPQTDITRPIHRQREAEARASMLGQILTPSAADRLGRIRMVKEDRATDVENRLIMLARSGQLREKVTEDQLKDLLTAVAEQKDKTEQQKIVTTRRKGGWDDDDELDDLLESL